MSVIIIITEKEWVYRVKVHDFDPGYPGKLTGENCYPGEESELDFSVSLITSAGLCGDYADILMPSDLEKKIIEKLTEFEL